MAQLAESVEGHSLYSCLQHLVLMCIRLLVLMEKKMSSLFYFQDGWVEGKCIDRQDGTEWFVPIRN